MIALLLFPLAARAGTYTGPVYTGTGSCDCTDPSGNVIHFPYRLNSGTYGEGRTFPFPSIKCQGPVTATFTWVPASGQTQATDPPPASVIICETASASWNGYAGKPTAPAPTGSCSDGIGDAEVDTVGPGGANAPFYRGDSSGTRYKVVAGAAQIVLKPTPSASLTFPTLPVGGAAAGVSYSATATPVIIPAPTGTTLYNGSLQLLTGQQITARVSASLPIDPASYIWSTGSNNTFKTYNPFLANPTATKNQLTLLSGSDFTQPQFSLYDKASDTFTIECHAIVVTPSGSRLPVVADSQPITCKKPVEAAWGIKSAQAPDVPFSHNYLNNSYDPRYGVQVTWNPISVAVPLPFIGGQVCIAQIASLKRVATRVALNGASNTYNVIPNSQGLDTGFPYQFAYQLDAKGNVVIGADGSYAVLSPPQWSASSLGAGGDRPNTVCEPALVGGDTGGDDWRSSSASDQFDTWTMYQPPAVAGQPTVWVPLQKINWAWSGSASVQTDALGAIVLDANNNAQWNFVGLQSARQGPPPIQRPPRRGRQRFHTV